MTQDERDRLVTLKKTKKRMLKQREAAEELEVSERHVRRLISGITGHGDKAVIHGLKGRPSNRAIGEETKSRAMEILSRPVYRDFGPTLASEELGKRYQIEVSRETVRKWMSEAKIWRPKQAKVEKIHMWRPRRSCCGELVQWDTSVHEWLEKRGERIYMIAMIDDATSRLFARFARQDSTEANMEVLELYLRRFGRPRAFYTDKASIFQTAVKTKRQQQKDEAESKPMPPTQMERALTELGIVWIAAHSPQAKGRVERSFDTAQDRLVKGMRVAGVSTAEGANQYLEDEYLPWWQENLTVQPADPDNVHRPLEKQHDLAAILSRVELHSVDSGYSFRFDSKRYRILPTDVRTGLRGSQVRVERRRDGSVAVRFQDAYLRFEECIVAHPNRSQAKAEPTKQRQTRQAPNAGGRSKWMRNFDLQEALSLRKAIKIANATS